MTRSACGAAAVAFGLSVSIACGIPTDPSAEPLAGGVVVPAVDPASPAPSGAVGERPGEPTAETQIFLVKADRITAVARTPSVPGVGSSLEVLLEGPTEVELAGGLRTAIAPGTRLRSARVEGGTALIDLTSSFVEVGGQEQILAVAQFVFTATAVPGVNEVRFALAGQGVEVPRADGTLTPGPLTRADFVSLLA